MFRNMNLFRRVSELEKKREDLTEQLKFYEDKMWDADSRIIGLEYNLGISMTRLVKVEIDTANYDPKGDST